LATSAIPAPAKKARWLRRVLLALILLAAATAGVFYLRPTLFGVVSQRYTAWKIGFENHDVILGQYRIHYMVVGEGKPLVLVHGLAGRAENWLTLVPEFTRNGYRVYALDLLGYGRSDQPDVDYSIALQSDILRQFLDSQRLQQPDIAGWSMGGWVSLKFAADHPERVDRLVLLDSAGLLFDAVNADALRPTNQKELAHMMEVLTPHPQPIPAFVARDILRNFAVNDWVVARSLQSMRTGRDAMDGKMQAVKMPVLIVWGKEDILTPLSVGEGLHRGLPQSVLYLFDGTGHLAPTERSRQVSAAMVDFLKAEPPQTTGIVEIPVPR
jgi:pimeloyl-ACP methyl ester carboxylesterase